MKKRFWSKMIVLQLVLTFLLGSAALAAKPKALEDRSLVPRWWERPHLIKKIGLSDDQLSRIKEIYHLHAGTITQAHDALADERRRLGHVLIQDRFDDDKVQQQITVVQAALTEVFKAETALHYAMLKELDAEQRKAVVASVEQQRRPARHMKTVKTETSERKKLDRRYNRF